MTNREIADLLRRISAAYLITGESLFRIIAYDRAADSIEHISSNLKDLWNAGKLKDVPGIGPGIEHHLNELFKTGHVRHFDSVLKKVPEGVFPLLSIPGLGPKRAFALVKALKIKRAVTAVDDLKKAALAGKIAGIPGFGEKFQSVILESIGVFRKGDVKEKRILISEADAIAEDIISYLKKNAKIERIDILGSLRRQVSTIGDIDLAVTTPDSEEAIKHFCAYPHQKIIERGPTGASILTESGRQVDMRVVDNASYGGMLQYFTGSKNHNITLRNYALDHGMSLSEYGIKMLHKRNIPPKKDGGIYNQKKKLYEFAHERDFYTFIGVPWMAPELREDTGEIQAALAGKLPKIIELSELRGDLHIHTEYDLESSHDVGSNSLEEFLDEAAALGYDYIGISDHNPSMSTHKSSEIVSIMKRRKEFYEQHYSSWQKKSKKRVHLLIMMEIDINPEGKLALPEEAFEYIDAAIVSIHSSFSMNREAMTDRVITGLTGHPKVRVLGHPTGRLLGRREGYDLEWSRIFETCKKERIALEINAQPDRLDLPDTLVKEAAHLGLKLVIDSDSHSVAEMRLMKYGISVARRGWAEKSDIINTLGYNEIKAWLTKP